MSRTFVKIVILISLLLFIVLLGFSITAFKSFESFVTRKAYEENIKELNIIGDNIKSMHEIVKNFTFTEIDDTSVAPLFEKKTMDFGEMYGYVNELREELRINPIFHSVIFYSGTTGNYYSTIGSKADKDAFFVDAVRNYGKIQMLTPIPRTLPYEAYHIEDTVFTYLYYETDINEKVNRLMAVNMDAAWLCDQLGKLKGTSVKAYIIDKRTRTFIDDTRKIKNMDVLEERLVERITGPASEEGSFTVGENNGQRIYTYLWMPETDWVLVVEEPNTFIYQSIKLIRDMIVRITLSIAILALAAVLIISLTIYRPFGKLFKQVMGPARKIGIKAALMDDVKILSNVFDMNQKSLTDYKHYKNAADRILLENYIKAVILENNSMSNQLTSEFSSRYGDVLENGMILVMLKIDNLSAFEKLEDTARKAYRFAIVNISEEVLDLGYSAKTIYLGEGEFISLAFLDEGTELEKDGYINQCKQKIMFLQEKINEFAGITLSAFVGGYASGTIDIVRAYGLASVLSKYRIIYKKESILDMLTLDMHEKNHCLYDEGIEEKILDSIRSGNIEAARTSFDKLVEMTSRGDIEDFMLSITRFSLALGKTIDILNKRRIGKIPVAMKDFYKKMTMAESIEDLKNWFYELMENALDKREPSDARHDALVESVKNYINENYARDLSLKMIAAEFKLSQGYMGAIFKEYTGLSVMDYINNSRLDRALLLLTESELSITDIMEKTGFINESNFYKLFKKKHGVTPKSYRVNKEIIARSGL